MDDRVLARTFARILRFQKEANSLKAQLYKHLGEGVTAPYLFNTIFRAIDQTLEKQISAQNIEQFISKWLP